MRILNGTKYNLRISIGTGETNGKDLLTQKKQYSVVF